MSKLFRSVMFGGRDLLMNPDNGTSGGGAPGASNEEGDEEESEEGNEGAGEEGEGEEGEDEGEDEPEVDPLDVPQFTKRQVAGMISGRINDIKKQYANHGELNEVATMIGEIIGAPNFDTIVQNIRGLHAQHRTKSGLPPVAAPPYQAPSQAETKRNATVSEFDNSFVKNPEYADASLFRDEIIDMAQNGFTLQQAYWAVAGPLVSGKKAEAAAKQATQVAQNKQKKAKHKQVTPGATGSPGNTGKPVIPPHVKAAAEKIGMDPEEYMAWGGITTLDQAQALRGKK